MIRWSQVAPRTFDVESWWAQPCFPVGSGYPGNVATVDIGQTLASRWFRTISGRRVSPSRTV